MKWGHISDLLCSQLEKVESIDYDQVLSPCETRDEFEQSLRRCYEASSKKILDAIEFLIRTGHWPEMSPMVKFFMKPRIIFAWKVTSSLSKPLLGEPLPTFSSNLDYHLVWALVDIWSAVGFDCWVLEEGNRFQCLATGSRKIIQP